MDEPRGLAAAEAARRLAEFGPNTTPDEAPRPLWRLAGKFIAPVPCLLEAAILLQLVLGEYVEAGVVAVLLTFNALLGFVQESRAQATLTALKSRLSLWALATAVRDRWPPVHLLVASGLKAPTEKEFPGIGRFIPKPYAPKQVLAALHDLLGANPAPYRYFNDVIQNYGKAA